jgi:tetratricopeptide (TPR) repeat protein
MRYLCPSCRRVFYLETKVESPCPACGSMLRIDEEEGAAAGKEPEQTEVLPGGSWLVGEEAAAPSAPASQTPSGAAPSVSSWLGEDILEEATKLDLVASEQAPPPPPAAEWTAEPAVDSGALEIPEPAEPPPPPEPPRPAAPTMQTMGLEGPRAPSGGRIFLVTSLVVILAALAAFLALTLLKPEFIMPVPAPVATADPKSQEKIKALEAEVEKLKADGEKLSADLKAGGEELASLQAKLEEEKGAAEAGREAKSRLSEAALLTLRAVSLAERRSDVGLAKAVELVDEALAKDPTFTPAHRTKGRVLAALGRPDGALGAFEAADESARAAGRAGDIESLLWAGEVCLTDLGDRERALAYYQSAAGLDTESVHRELARARVLFLQGKLDEAASVAEEARKAEPALALAPLILGEAGLQRAARKSGAERRALLEAADPPLAEAVRLYPNSSRGCLMRGRLLLAEATAEAAPGGFKMPRLGRQSEAERLLTKVKRLSPNLPDVHLALAELKLVEGALHDPAAAVVRAGEAVRLTERKSAPALAVLAEAEAATGDPVNAAKTIEEALKLDPKNEDYRAALERYRADARALAP